ncbi:MAG: glycosyl transferase [Magnetococcales bacterium]|nr:glycosyl transferase [Magnetococcales bacterium]
MAGDMNLVELIGHADRWMQAGQLEETIGLYREWLAMQVDHPQRHFALYNLGVVLLNSQDHAGARQAFEEAIGLQPDFYPSYINLGNALERLGLPGDAVACWRTLAERLSVVTGENIQYKSSALKQMARVLGPVDSGDFLRQVLEIDPRHPEVREHWINGRQTRCDWPVIEPFGGCDRNHLMRGFAPLSLAVFTDDPLWQLANTAMFHRSDIGQPATVDLKAHQALRRAPPPRIRVGYLSSDLRVHAIGFLMAELFELHDRQQVEVFVYAVGLPIEDPMKQRIRGAVEQWRDAYGLGDAELAALIVADGIEILVDVNGYTHSARTRMLAMRPAPVIVNWLGYPGTMGSPYHHYLITDGFIVPEELEFCYSEQVMRLPCYQPNDRQRVVDPYRPDRQAVGLPDGVMVYGCFNGTKKITPHTWDLWMRVLEQVEGSVLWLLHENDAAKERLVTLATGRGIAAERIVFAPRLPHAQHMARYPLVDLMLDSTPYGAHTTASDALWMGVPILTMAGLSFAARVCGSLVTAAGLGDLVCTGPDAFVARAVELGRNRELLDHYRTRLAAGRESCVLFDTPLLVSSLEGLYRQMRAAFLENRLPRPDLSNLELYREIAIELDATDGVWFGTVERLKDAYLGKLVERDRLAYLPDDGRLWSAENRARAARQRPFLEVLLEWDDADDLNGLIHFVSQAGHDPADQLLAVAQAMIQDRVRAAYVVSMLLANAGYRHAVLAVGLCLGGVIFNNPQEVARGAGELPGQMAALTLEQRTHLVHALIKPVVALVEQAGRQGADPHQVALVLELLGQVRG